MCTPSTTGRSRPKAEGFRTARRKRASCTVLEIRVFRDLHLGMAGVFGVLQVQEFCSEHGRTFPVWRPYCEVLSDAFQAASGRERARSAGFTARNNSSKSDHGLPLPDFGADTRGGAEQVRRPGGRAVVPHGASHLERAVEARDEALRDSQGCCKGLRVPPGARTP